MELSEIRGFFINLDHRLDRRASMASELERVGLSQVRRLPAVRRSLGILGAGLSHVKALEGWTPNQPVILICEDDIEFLEEPEVINKVINRFLRNPSLDVLCLSYNVRERPFPVDSVLSITSNTQTSSCYLVKHWAIAALKANFSEGVKLLSEGFPPRFAAVDIYWKRVQRSVLTFSVPNKPLVRQVASYSDNLGRWVEPIH